MADLLDPAITVTDTDVSVVVQGPATAKLPTVVQSVRNWLPGAELIVSTWVGAAVDDLDVDHLVLNEDPGSAPYCDGRGHPTLKQFNTNRMLRSTAAGLARATRPFSLKIRNDTPLRSDAVLSWLAEPDAPRDEAVRIFRRRIVMPNIAVRPADAMPGYLFHPSDIVHAGCTSDLQDLWDGELIDEQSNAGWFTARPRPVPDNMPYSWCRYYNEQVLWLRCLERHGVDHGYEHAGQYSAELAIRSERYLLSNFICLEPWQLGIELPFTDLTRQFDTWQYYWHPAWQRAMERLCPSSEPPVDRRPAATTREAP